MIWLALAFTAAAIIVIKFLISLRRNQKYAPGPIVWPLIGNVVEIKLADAEYPHLALAKMAKKYGNVIGFGFGSTYSVVVSGFEEMKDIFKRSETAEERYEFPYVKDRSFNKNLGIVWASGDVWRDMRRFTVKTLIEFGFGKKKSMDILIAEETNAVLEDIRTSASENNGIWNVDSHYLAATTLNVLWSLVAGERFNHNDERLLENLRLNDRFANIIGHNNIYNAFPFLKRLCPKLVQHDIHMQTHRDVQNYMKGVVDEIRIKRSERADNAAQNFVEVFLDEIQKNRGSTSTFTEEQLIVILMDLFFAGAETTSTTLNWAILFLTLNPDVQLKLQHEIKEATSQTHRISVQEAAKLPYLKAVLMEVFRLAVPVPMVPPHLASEDVYLNNFLIPKGTPIFGNVFPVFSDEKFWGDPKVFRPERFLDDNGVIIPHIAQRMDATFGFGKRACLGEVMARDSLNMFVVAIFGNFTFKSIPGKEPSQDNPISAITITPRPYGVQVLSKQLQTYD